MLTLQVAPDGPTPTSTTLQGCIDQAEFHDYELPTCKEVDGGYVATWPDSGSFGSGGMDDLGAGPDIGALFGVFFFVVVLIGIATTAWKVSTARRLAESSGMDQGIATQMALLTDDGLESTYLAANLRGAKPADAAARPAPARERLAELKGLLDDGLITQAEHDERRRAILDAV